MFDRLPLMKDPLNVRRAELLYGFLAKRVLRAVNTYNRAGNTRYGLGLRGGEREAPSQIDFVFCSQGVIAVLTPAWIDGALETDHSPICQQLCFHSLEPSQTEADVQDASGESGEEECATFTMAAPQPCQIPGTCLGMQHARDVWSEMERIRILVAGERGNNSGKTLTDQT